VIADSFDWFHLWLTLHILAVIVAFGPTFAFGMIAALGQKSLQHAGFAVEVIYTIESKMTIPLAVVVPFLGLALIYAGHFNLWKSEWLLIAIVLYMIAFFFAVFVQNKTGSRLVQLMEAMPPGPPPPGTEPPAEVMALVKRLQVGGMFLVFMVVIITILMVWRPGSCQGIC
jgi:hypothetical protein